jgi:CRP-like cAMP-binding protein
MSAKDILHAHLAQTITLTDVQFDYCFSHFNSISLQKGQVLITAGDRVDSEFFVTSGCLKSFYINEDMKMFVLQFAMRNWWTSDYAALYNGTPASINVDCVLDADVLSITNNDREKLCKEIHAIEHFFRIRTNKGYVASQKRLLSTMNNNVRARYEELIRQYPDLYQLLPKTLIAAYLGVSRETLSRLYNDEK